MKKIIVCLFLLLCSQKIFAHQRIVCLAPSITEMVYALEAGDNIVGVTTYSNYPPCAKKKPKVGTFNRPSLELIITLKPDLVFALEKANPPQFISHLKNLGFSVIVLKNGGLETIWKNLLTIGKVLGKEDKATALVKDLKSRMHDLAKQVEGLPKPKVFWQVAMNPLISCGNGSYHHELITLAGGINIVKEKSAYPAYSLERVLIAKPDVIIASTMSFQKKRIINFWKHFPWLPAVQKEQIYIVNPDLFDRPSPRVVQALEILISILHPEVKLAS